MRRRRDALDQILQRQSVSPEDRVAGAPRGRERNLRRHEWVSVAIAADPVAELNRDRLQQLLAGAAEYFLIRAEQCHSRALTRVEQTRFEIPQYGADLVLYR